METIAPKRLAEKWDNVGALIGTDKDIKRILVALTLTHDTALEAVECGADLLLTHHPIWLGGIKHIESDDPAYILIKNEIGFFAAHTNLDAVKGGVNDVLAHALKLQNARPIETSSQDMKKLCVYVPAEYADKLIKAMNSAGAGQSGDYEGCGWSVAGEGRFTPLENAKPFIGAVGADERVNEIKYETIVSKGKLEAVIAALYANHPYEQPAFDIYSLENNELCQGMGRVGELEREMPLVEFVECVRKAVGAPVRFGGEAQRQIRKVAVCGGGGMSLIGGVMASGADVFVTGDVKLHDLYDALDAGLAIIDAGHYETEQIVIGALIDGLQAELNKLQYKVEIYRSTVERPSWHTFGA